MVLDDEPGGSHAIVSGDSPPNWNLHIYISDTGAIAPVFSYLDLYRAFLLLSRIFSGPYI